MPHSRIIDAIDNEHKRPETLSAEKRARYVQLRADGHNATESARLAGYPKRVQNSPIKLIETSDYRARFQQAIESKGITLDKIAGKLADHMDAENAEGMPLYKVQSRAIDQVTELIGMKDASKLAQSGSSVKLELAGPIAERFAEYLAGKGNG